MVVESSFKFWKDERYLRRAIYRLGDYITNLNSAALYSGTQDTNKKTPLRRRLLYKEDSLTKKTRLLRRLLPLRKRLPYKEDSFTKEIPLRRRLLPSRK